MGVQDLGFNVSSFGLRASGFGLVGALGSLKG